ncbi:signal-regulatory protein beta-2-like [Pelmatolapia mariae]|uniref:signal-regulatory protein beta-2-like n=1 Tax=Pelmatolapia mariae TaxID=158779 RepID=UPI003211EB49
MIVLWVILLVLHRGYTLVPVTTVQLGETVTIPCNLPAIETIRKEVHWYKQSTGDTLKVIWTMRESATPEFTPEFNNSRLKVNHHKHFTSLTILKTNQEDEGIYHCGFTEWRKNTEWTGTYLLVKGNTQGTSNYTFVKEKVHPGDSVTLQCSVLSNSNRKTCPGGHNVFWFREANPSHPSIIYTDGNRHHECKKRSETQQSCVYRLSKNISSSDSGTYYCAVATCGEILFGNATKQQMAQTAGLEFISLVIAIIFLIISVILNIIFICWRTPRAACKQFQTPEWLERWFIERSMDKILEKLEAAVNTQTKTSERKLDDILEKFTAVVSSENLLFERKIDNISGKLTALQREIERPVSDC